MTNERQNRFINNNLPKLEDGSHNPLSDYEDTSVRTLEKAVENIIQFVPDVVNYVSTAKKDCNRNLTFLTWDEEAAIRLYTMSTPFVTKLNQTLRCENKRVPKSWFPFLKLFVAALKKLPSTKATVWRGVNYDATLTFVEDEMYTWWNITSCSKNVNRVRPFLGESGTLFTIETIDGRDISMFSAIPDEQEVILMPGTRVHARFQPFSFIDRLFIIQLEEIAPQIVSRSESKHLLEQIKQEYQRNSRIQRFMDPSKSFPIEQSYINLAIVEAKELHEKEKQLSNAQHAADVLGTFEEIYGMKTAIDVKHIFETCKNHQKQVLVFGRAGIGKSTFCQYVAYQWAIGSYWSQYQLLALIPLRCLTVHRYPPDKSYSLFDLVKKEVFSFDLTDKEGELLKKQFDAKNTLWILDGYDEVVQNVPPHLEYLLEQLLKTSHHIITSRPYLNTLSYDVQMEITGFTGDNITEYVQQFFHQMKDELDDAMIKSQRLLNFLRSNQSIWGVAHIPMNLELICSIWSDADWSETEQLTITILYTRMTEWLCRCYLRTHNHQILQLSQNELDQRCKKELAFLEHLAFIAMENITIIIRSSLLKKVLNEAKVSSEEHPHILNMGILKSVNKQGIGNRIEIEKDHYFVHLSFQEYFAARYLINALKDSRIEKAAIEFIKTQKYNQRYTLVFTFAAGLLSENNDKPYFDVFWDNILEEPLDLVGIRHMQLVIFFTEETTGKFTLSRRTELLQWIAVCLKDSFITKTEIAWRLLQSLQRAPSVVCDQRIINVLISLLQDTDIDTKIAVLSFISNLKISNPPISLITSVINGLDDRDLQVKGNACEALGKMGENSATNEVITMLVSALGDESDDMRIYASEALGIMGEKAATNEAITKLVSALGDESYYVRMNAYEALGNMGEKAATYEVITKLASALGDESDYIGSYAGEALVKIGEKAATNEVITKLVKLLGYESDDVRTNAYATLLKMDDKAATNEVITKLLSALGDESYYVRMNACEALGKIGENAATNKVIAKLLSALGDESYYVRMNACKALGNMGEKVAMNEVIPKLVSLLGDDSEEVRRYASEALGKMGEKVTMNEVITKLASALGDVSDYIRRNACEALEKIGEKAATNEVITKLVSLLGDKNDHVRMNACRALGNMGEKAATNEMVTKLVSLLEDESYYVRMNACEALGKMGEKAAMNQVITKLVNALGDESYYVRMNACEALGKMGEKAATHEVITKLASALGDESDYIGSYAGEALVKIGEKAATNEVITKLVSLLQDKSDYVRMNACRALGKIGEKAATNEVISELVVVMNNNSQREGEAAMLAVGNILSSSVVIKQLAPKIIADLCLCRDASYCLKNVSEDELMNFFLDTEDPDWLSVVTQLTLLKGAAVTITENKVVVYGMTEPVELRLRNSKLRQRLIDAFTNQAKRLRLCPEVPLEGARKES